MQCEETVARLEQMVHDSRQSTEKIQKEYNHLNEKVVKLHHDLEEQIHTNTQLLAENSQKQVELKHRDDDINKLKAENQKIVLLEHVYYRQKLAKLQRQESRS